jgi:hypothetical protein
MWNVEMGFLFWVFGKKNGCFFWAAAFFKIKILVNARKIIERRLFFLLPTTHFHEKSKSNKRPPTNQKRPFLSFLT